MVTKIVTANTNDLRGINSWSLNMPLPTAPIMGTAKRPAAIVMPSRRTKSAGGSTAPHMSIGYIMLRAKAAPDLGLPTM